MYRRRRNLTLGGDTLAELPRIAVLSASTASRGAAAIGREALTSLGDLGELAERAGYGQVVVHPDALHVLDLPAPPYSRAVGGTHPFMRAPGWRITPTSGELRSFYTLRRSRRRSVDVFLPSYDDAAGLAGLDPDAMLRALVAYRDALGVCYRYSPGHTGTRLMLDAHRGDLGPSTTADLEPAADGGTEADFHTVRDPTDDELRMGFVHAYDARARYLASCSAVALGIGEPDELTGSVGFSLTPGYWHVTLREPPRGLDPFRGLRQGWVTTPTAYQALQLGALDTIDHAYVWPESERALRPWYSRIAAALKVLDRPGHEPERLLLKRTYAIAIGWLAGHWTKPGDVLHRPDWRHAIIAQSRANLYRRVRAAAVDPIAVDVDAIYVASHSPDPLASSGVYLSLVGSNLGAFRVVGSGKLATAQEMIRDGTAPIDAYREVCHG